MCKDNRIWEIVIVVLGLTTIFGCPAKRDTGTGGTSGISPVDARGKGDRSMTIELTSNDFDAGEPIPKQFTGEGEDRSPHLAWKNLPDGTAQLALICDDPDAPTDDPWVHWIIYGIDPSISFLPGGLAKSATLNKPVRAMQGKNSWTDGQTVGYRGPMPPPGHGVHHYHFTLYALDARLDLKPGIDKKQLVAAMAGHILGTGERIGTYQR